MDQPTIIKSSSVKEGIFYDAIALNDDQEIDFLELFKTIAPDFDSLKPKEMPTGIIYCQTFDDLDKTVQSLQNSCIPVTTFHAKLDFTERFKNYDDFMADKYPIIVATSESFGLGIVKKFVKFVIHINLPKHLRAYYQESGRAGMNGERARSRIYYKKNSLRRSQQMCDYLISKDCRKKIIASYFGEEITDCVNRCDNCTDLQKKLSSESRSQCLDLNANLKMISNIDNHS